MKHYLQSNGMCGPTCLRMALSHYGAELSEDSLATLCKSTKEEGTSHIGLGKAVWDLGGNFSLFEGLPDDVSLHVLKYYLKKDRPIIVGWFKVTADSAEEHYSIVADLDDESIWLLDPEEKDKVRIALKDFLPVWYDTEEMNGQYIRQWHWFMVVDFPKGVKDEKGIHTN